MNRYYSCIQMRDVKKNRRKFMSYLITSTEVIDKRKHLKGARQKCLASCMSKDGNRHKKTCVPTTPT
jgi:hypothetical protein